MQRPSTVVGLSFYRQPGGCVEAAQTEENNHAVLHFCSDQDAMLFLREFTAFIQTTPVDCPCDGTGPCRCIDTRCSCNEYRNGQPLKPHNQIPATGPAAGPPPARDEWRVGRDGPG